MQWASLKGPPGLKASSLCETLFAAAHGGFKSFALGYVCASMTLALPI